MELVNIMELLKEENKNVIVTEKNKPNLSLLAQAFINLRKESLK